MLKMLPALPMLRIEPELPMLRIEPALPMDRIEPTLPILRTLPKLKMLPTLPKLKMLNKLLVLSRPVRLPVLMVARPRLHLDRTDSRIADPSPYVASYPLPRENTLAAYRRSRLTSPSRRPLCLPDRAVVRDATRPLSRRRQPHPWHAQKPKNVLQPGRYGPLRSGQTTTAHLIRHLQIGRITGAPERARIRR
jgi:hypothetical protein